ncbi:uncharacterized protein LOC135954481 isoform X2 [Calliphora vicina]|uniref:uncharacterized protein LOC135954481 isoform X2 n=1 Tax=Calliphora vicina TaxID=7373 RepID=UPI00325B350F
MMPFSKEKNRRIYITALVISFLLIVGSIYLHLRQKTHLGRMSFNLDRDRVKPTSGVESTTWMDDYDSKYRKVSDENFNTAEDDTDVENDIVEASSPGDDDEMPYINARQFETDDDIDDDINEDIDDDIDGDLDEDLDDDIDDIAENSESDMILISNDSSACLRCLCMTVNECLPTFCGSGNPCGLYRISKLYWIDGGRPTIAGGSTDNEDQDYLTCVNDDSCSATVIRQYYDRYKRDCNKDQLFDCKDQIALHLLGPSGCLTQNLSNIHANRMKKCFTESYPDYYGYSSEEYYVQ